MAETHVRDRDLWCPWKRGWAEIHSCCLETSKLKQRGPEI